MKEKILPFIKKYPMSILLAIIAIQLVNISQKLDQSGKLAGDQRACTRWLAYINNKLYEEANAERRKAAAKIGISHELVRAYCRRLRDFP